MSRRYFIAAAIITAIICGEAGCGGAAAIARAAGKVPVITLYRGKTGYLKMPKNPKKKALQRYRYASSRPKIVSVSKRGKIKAKKAGTAIVTMRRKGRKKEAFRYRIHAVDYVGAISLASASQVVLNIGESSAVRAKVLPKTAGERSILFSSRDEAVAKVSPAGEIVAVEEGMTYIDVTSKGKKKNGKKVRKQILVYVNAKAIEAPEPAIPSRGDVVIEVPGWTAAPPATQPPKESGEPSAQPPQESGEPSAQPPQESGEPLATQPPKESGEPPAQPPEESWEPPATQPPETAAPPQTLEEYIAAIEPPGPQTLQAASFVVSSQGRISTLYFLNKSYTGNVSLVIDGVQLQGAGSAEQLLAELQREVGAVLKGPYFTGADGVSRRIFRIGRKSGSEPWVIQNRRDNTAYSFYVMETDSVYGTPYGLIVADGDTSARITVQ